MKILSWDVGIINLAYCIIEKDEEHKIKDWGTINLLNENNHECNGFIDSSNANNKCSRPCKFYYENGGNKYYFCGLHKKQYSKIEKCELVIEKYKGETLCEEITSKGVPCNKKSNSIVNGKIICNYHLNNLKKKHNENDIKKIIVPNATKAPIEIIKRNLIDHLDKKTEFLDVDYVLIENQPSMKNPKMKSVAETLYSWFLIRGLVDKKGLLQNIFYLSPSNKIKIKNDDIDKEIKKVKDERQKYKLTKNIGIIYTKDLLKNDSNWIQYLDANKKKDDLCDSFLQGMYFYDNFTKFVKSKL